MDSIQEVFEMVKLEPFCNEYTTIKARSGLYHRMKGKSTDGKPKQLTEDDQKQLDAGLVKMMEDINGVLVKLRESRIPKE